MNNRVVVIAGASRKLGRSMAVHQARRGLGIVGTYHSSEDAAYDAPYPDTRFKGGVRRFPNLVPDNPEIPRSTSFF